MSAENRKMDWEKANNREKAAPVAKDHETVAWWWTPARFGSRCPECGCAVAKGSAIAYSHLEQRSMCEVCADSQGLSPRPSKKWLRMQESLRKGSSGVKR